MNDQKPKTTAGQSSEGGHRTHRGLGDYSVQVSSVVGDVVGGGVAPRCYTRKTLETRVAGPAARQLSPQGIFVWYTDHRGTGSVISTEYCTYM